MSSAKPICVEFYRHTSPITIVGDHTARWAKQLHAEMRCLSGSTLVQRSPRYLCSAGYTTFTAPLHDKFLRPTGTTEAQQAGVNLADIAEHAQHADINTTRKHYIVPSVETSRRVAKQRVAHRQVKKNTP